MRIFSYILTALVSIFVLNIVLSFSIPVYRNTLVDVRTGFFPTSEKTVPTKETPDRITDTRLAESLDRIDKHIESLTAKKETNTGTMTATMSGTNNTLSGTVMKSISWATTAIEEATPKEPEILLSWIFLSKIMPEITPKKIENTGFFGIQVMGKIVYNTYTDETKKIKIYAFRETYDTLLLNMKLASSVYKLNETDQFFWFTFFLNPSKKDPKDTTVRFVTALEWQAIGIEVPKDYYPQLKKMLLKNK